MKIKQKNKEDFYRTEDLGLSTTLYTLNIPLESIERSLNERKVTFVFSNENNNLQQILQQYWRKEIRIEPQTYFQSLRQLKNLIYSY